jgi:hypothetical protein
MPERRTPQSDLGRESAGAAKQPYFCVSCNAGPLRRVWWFLEKPLRGPFCAKCFSQKVGNA